MSTDAKCNSFINPKKSDQIVVFSIDERRYALPLATVERIVRVVEITPLPKVPDIVQGIINVQGRIIPVINIRKRFGLPEREINLSDQLIIAQASNHNFALLVDTVSGVIEYSEHDVVEAQEVIPGAEYVKGMIKLENGINLVLDLDTLLSFKEVGSLDDAIKEPHGGGL
ncbi:MAG: chemotaxis protein CheW [Candidatus Methanoperedens sp.]|nr:chemotaxis protein CheW [Candidatus Methanoperedens sp.]